MSKAPSFFFLTFATLLAGATAFAQTTAQSQPQTPSQIGSRIHLDVVVRPKSGPPVGGLQQKDFTVLDNKSTVPLTGFQAVSGNQAQIEVILLIDAVNTSYQNIAYERGQIEKFLRADGGHLAHLTAIAILTDRGTQIQNGFSTDGNALSKVLDSYGIGLRDIRRSAGFYGAAERFDLSMNGMRLLTAHESQRPGRKIILWISPGWPLLTGPNVQLDAKQQRQLFATIVEMSTQLRQARVTLYSIDSLGVDENLERVDYYQQFVKGIAKPGKTDPADLSLQVLALQSGGLALNSTDVAGLMKQSLSDTESYYELSFNAVPAEQGVEYHNLEVKIDQSGVAARTRDGYYSQAVSTQGAQHP